ncbi:MAG: HD domain-containing protein [Clostridiales bacterium]|jgi:metal-dependent HD superfamily phosphatase/phosphodiesterase|nr:HD domain-containing protein [Clostridiales bacterium]
MGFKELVKNNEEILELINASERCLDMMNYTEHGLRHAMYVASVTEKILKKLGYDNDEAELGFIAGYMHDTGNSINRNYHGHVSAMFAYRILKDLGMPYKDINTVTAAIGNHEEETGTPINAVSAALIIADKSDAHRTRVTQKYDPNEIHDRVNHAIKKNVVYINPEKRAISSRIYMNATSSVMEYFEIYLSRISMSEKAAKLLDCTFKLFINDVLINSPKEIKRIVTMPEKGDNPLD